MYHILMTRKLLIQNHLKLTVKSLGNWGQGNNDAFEFELSFDPGELELDSKWKICWDNPYPPGLTFDDADKVRVPWTAQAATGPVHEDRVDQCFDPWTLG